MAIFSQYGTAQRVGFAIVCVSFALCLPGAIAPFWLTAETSVGVGDIPLFGNLELKLMDIHVGIWYYCYKPILKDEECYSMYDTSDYQGPGKKEIDDKFAWIDVARGCVSFNILLSLISALVACCRCSCCSGGRTICHGILSLIAGAFGIAAFAIVYNHTNSLVNRNIVNVDYGWAMSIFALGSVLLMIASLFLCFGIPRETNYGLVVANPPAPGISVNVSTSNTNTNTYNAGGPIRSFEPLPYPGQYPPQPLGQYPPPAAGHFPPPVAGQYQPPPGYEQAPSYDYTTSGAGGKGGY